MARLLQVICVPARAGKPYFQHDIKCDVHQCSCMDATSVLLRSRLCHSPSHCRAVVSYCAGLQACYRWSPTGHARLVASWQAH